IGDAVRPSGSDPGSPIPATMEGRTPRALFHSMFGVRRSPREAQPFTRFGVRCFALARSGAAFGPPLAPQTSGIMSESSRILVVEDEKAVGHMTAMVLGGPACKVSRARNGWEALIKIGVTPKPFDIIITDHRMPRMTGLDLVRRLRTQNFG